MNLRSGICLGVAIAHGAAFGLAAMSVDHAPSNFGGAPVIELTLSPSVMFNGPQGSQTSASQASSASPPAPSRANSEVTAKTTAAQVSTNQADQTEPRQPQTPVAASSSDSATPAKPSDTPKGTGTASAKPSDSDADNGKHQASQSSQAGLSQGHGASTLGGSAQAQTDTYEATVIRWIEQHKSHPGGPNGVVTLGFTLDRRGNLRASRILVSSGNTTLDRTALDQLKAASPFPRPPHGTTWQTRDFRVRMDYQTAPRR